MVQSGGQAEDIALVCALGLGINNDNMPASENIPDGTNAVTIILTQEELLNILKKAGGGLELTIGSS